MNVLVVAAHPDDEVLGCGGTLARHRDRGDKIAWLIVTRVTTEAGFTEQRVASRAEEIKTIAQRLGGARVFQLDYPTMSLHSGSLPALVPDVSRVFNEFQPECVYVMNRSDAHTDHGICFRAVASCTKSFRYPFLKRVLMYECLSETEFALPLPENVFLPNYYVDISAYLEEKCSLMEVYASELGEHPFPRSLDNIKALAHLRGAVAGVAYAEAFQLLKYVWD